MVTLNIVKPKKNNVFLGGKLADPALLVTLLVENSTTFNFHFETSPKSQDQDTKLIIFIFISVITSIDFNDLTNEEYENVCKNTFR